MGHGIIPACAGSTGHNAGYALRSRDHPRMCGEHVDPDNPESDPMGSSPHVRGALKCGFAAVPGLRIIPACAGSTGVVLMRFFPNGIIPACAGSTKRLSSTEMPFRDHPRMCGEHLDAGSEQKPCPGSSPHVRGARHILLLSCLRIGIIPACAGSTRRAPLISPPRWDHPRMCGEHFSCASIFDISPGSSPHVRGARTGGCGCDVVRGIIPACAGSTPSTSLVTCAFWDHPRMCGEHYARLKQKAFGLGSSPHVRGALDLEFANFRLRGIIPACAGSTCLSDFERSVFGDHPRMCGEHYYRFSQLEPHAGSSPHVRGALVLRGAVQPIRGIIPACAGSTYGLASI